MPKYYSPSKKGFYDAPQIADCILVTDTNFQSLMDGQITQDIVPDSTGNPILQARTQSISDKDSMYRQQLTHIDAQKVRALSDAILTGDHTRLQTLENQAVIIRGQLAALPPH